MLVLVMCVPDSFAICPDEKLSKHPTIRQTSEQLKYYAFHVTAPITILIQMGIFQSVLHQRNIGIGKDIDLGI